MRSIFDWAEGKGFKKKRKKGNGPGQNDLSAPFSFLLFFYRLAESVGWGNSSLPFSFFLFYFWQNLISVNFRHVVFQPISILKAIVCSTFRLDKGRTSKGRIPRSYKHKERFAMNRSRCKSPTDDQDTNATLLKITVKTRSVEGNMGKSSLTKGLRDKKVKFLGHKVRRKVEHLMKQARS